MLICLVCLQPLSSSARLWFPALRCSHRRWEAVHLWQRRVRSFGSKVDIQQDAARESGRTGGIPCGAGERRCWLFALRPKTEKSSADQQVDFPRCPVASTTRWFCLSTAWWCGPLEMEITANLELVPLQPNTTLRYDQHKFTVLHFI